MLTEELIQDQPVPKEVIEAILRDCQPFLQEIDGHVDKHILWRGLSYTGNKFGKKEARLHSREVLNTPEVVHDQMNFFYNEFYGHPYRNGVFASGNQDNARSYQHFTKGVPLQPRAIFPIGNFEYIWNPKIDDMFNLLMAAGFAGIPQLMKELQPTFKTDNLKGALALDVEIMLWVEEYYYLDVELLPHLGKYLL